MAKKPDGMEGNGWELFSICLCLTISYNLLAGWLARQPPPLSL